MTTLTSLGRVYSFWQRYERQFHCHPRTLLTLFHDLKPEPPRPAAAVRQSRRTQAPPPLSGSERAKLIEDQVEEQWRDQEWVQEIREYYKVGRGVRPLEQVIRWSLGVAEMAAYYKERNVSAPPGYTKKGWVVKYTNLGHMLGPDRDWIQRAVECAEWIACPGIRRRRTQVDECYRNHFPDNVANEPPPPETPYEAKISYFGRPEARVPRILWSIDSLHTELKAATGEESLVGTVPNIQEAD